MAYSVELTEFKIEQGTKPTAWTPAPEDIDSEMSGLVVKSWTEYNINTSTQTPPAEGDGKWSIGLSTANIGKGQYLWTRTANEPKVGPVFYTGYTCLVHQQKELDKQYTQYALNNDIVSAPAETSSA